MGEEPDGKRASTLSEPSLCWVGSGPAQGVGRCLSHAGQGPFFSACCHSSQGFTAWVGGTEEPAPGLYATLLPIAWTALTFRFWNSFSSSLRTSSCFSTESCWNSPRSIYNPKMLLNGEEMVRSPLPPRTRPEETSSKEGLTCLLPLGYPRQVNGPCEIPDRVRAAVPRPRFPRDRARRCVCWSWEGC